MVFRTTSLVIFIAAWASAAGPKAPPAPPPAPQEQARSIRRAVEDLRDTFGSAYPEAGPFLAEVDAIGRRLEAKDPAAGTDLERLARRALLANPLLRSPILFVARPQYVKDHHNTATFFPAAKHEYNNGRFQGGGALKVLDVSTGKVTTLVELPKGMVRDPEVSFDGRSILVSMRKDAADSYHVYEVSADGKTVRQLTRLADVDDLDPLYLADGSIAFSSTREPKYCGCNRHIMANLFRMDGDGANIVQIGKSTLFEGHGALMPDGRILYDRWEYVDRNFGDAQGLWTCNPDGTNHAIFWGNNTPSPGGILDARVIPGSDRVVCTFSSCHDRPWGAIAIVDRSIGSDGKEPVVRTWPAEARNLVKNPGEANNAFDAFVQVKLKYEDPWPLAEAQTHAGAGKYFLAARMTGKGEQMGIYLIDVFGNEVLVHADEPGCFDPMPLAPRPRPATPATRRELAQAEGTFYIQDVYRGTHMAGVQRGEVKTLRVIEVPEKKFWTNPVWGGQGIEGPAMNWHDFNAKRILGTVPVEADGSVYFALAAEKFVYFQLLDERGMMIQSMRSGTMVQAGERGSCVGCHDDRRMTPPSGYAVPTALRRAPSRLEGWRGPARMFNYRAEVQRVFDKHCVSCHDFKDMPRAKVVLAGDRGLAFNASYSELWSKGQLKVAGAGPAEILQPRSWGSHASRLVQVLGDGHYDVKLDAESFDRIVTWVDLNAPYYPSFATAFPENPFGRSPLSGAQLSQLSKLTGVKFDRQPQSISFDRPEQSPSLAGLRERKDPRYAEALSLIEMGRESLARSPNPDAEGFAPCGIDLWRQQKYTQREELESRHRGAMVKGTKAYDP